MIKPSLKYPRNIDYILQGLSQSFQRERWRIGKAPSRLIYGLPNATPDSTLDYCYRLNALWCLRFPEGVRELL